MASVGTLDQASPRSAASAQTFAGSPSSRLLSLDVFRGMTIAGMILVNNPGTWNAIHAPLKHAEWNGWTPTDLIFPFFLFIVGVSMVFSFAARRERGQGRGLLLRHVVRRSIIIFGLGLFLAGFPYFHLATIRIMGVLQRIAVAYLFAAVITLWTGRRGRMLWIAGLLIGYWALMTYVPVPGYGAANLSPDGNLAAYIDRKVMFNHLWVKHRWDPEGLLSTIGAIATTLLGTLVGEWMRAPRPAQQKVASLLGMGAAGLIAGEIFGHWFPINKNLWTSSYVIFTAGFAAVLLALCYWLLDIRGWRSWAKPFLIFGLNSIAVFTLSGLLGKASVIWKTAMPDGRQVFWKTYVYERLFGSLLSPINASLMFAVSYVLFWLLMMWLLYRRGIFIKI